MNPFIDLGEYILNPEAMFSKLLKDRQFPLTHLGQDDNEALVLTANPDPNDINLLISHDQNGLNAGSFFLRKGRWTDVFLELWSDPIFTLEKKWWAQEQDALIHIFRKHYQFMNGHVGIVRQRELNAYVPDDLNRESLNKGKITVEAEFWTSDVIAIHFAGCW
jgi:galactosyl transferase GMA12/MNN10 family